MAIFAAFVLVIDIANAGGDAETNPSNITTGGTGQKNVAVKKEKLPVMSPEEAKKLPHGITPRCGPRGDCGHNKPADTK